MQPRLFARPHVCITVVVIVVIVVVAAEGDRLETSRVPHIAKRVKSADQGLGLTPRGRNLLGKGLRLSQCHDRRHLELLGTGDAANSSGRCGLTVLGPATNDALLGAQVLGLHAQQRLDVLVVDLVLAAVRVLRRVR
eukprot:Amastigsp_a178362_234.p2 type:complete len:137 gc:universal Amastigsp_a178362_234:1120-710(-)